MSMDGDDRSGDELLLNLIAEIQALAVAFNRLGERMAACDASHEENALTLLHFFQEKQLATTIYKVYLNSIRELEKSGKHAEKQISHVDSLCAKKLRKRYGMTF